jgi:hypoxanthine phosphoribosyltransferase
MAPSARPTSGTGRPPPEGPELLADAAALHAAVRRIGAAIDADHPEGVVLVGVLKGSLLFLADLARCITVPTRLEVVALAPYDGTSTRTRVLKDVDAPLAGESVVIVSGIVDTGLTADFVHRHLGQLEPATIRLATLADKAARRLIPVRPDYVAVDAPDRFLIGYGLDHLGRYRNLRDLWVGDREVLRADPDAYVPTLYPEPGS